MSRSPKTADRSTSERPAPPRHLSVEDITNWLNKNFGGGTIHSVRELPTNAFLRELNINVGDFWRYKNRKIPMPLRVQIVLSRFILDWEAGLLEFGGTGKKGSPRALVHRETPKPRPHRMMVTLDGQPRLRLLVKPPANPRSGTITDIVGNVSLNLTRKGG